MTLTALLNQPVTVDHVDHGALDALGNPTTSVTSSTDTTGYVEQTEAREMLVDRETYTTDWLVVLPADVTIDAGDRVRYSGRVLEVVGSPMAAFNPLPRKAATDHIEVRCVEVIG